MQHYLKIAKPFSLLSSILILVIANNTPSPIIIAKQALAIISSRSDSNTATITNIRLPGIIPNNNNNPPAPYSSGTGFVTNTNPSSSNPQSAAPPAIVHRNIELVLQ